ncbi:hypothetical protein KHO57_gp022 [Mycobacterium phage Phabba]|uniref:Uncharacterized protein n=1 Tax=Mycobacterium phage Phabba TaxID=2027899 RepID=A0A249XS81_9CAUD|nr:hypothetical protein KHO57_gp022 [Mycobacterium phage Phabba]ASZ74597.1 hypothetical protein SEA_PHABBA_22 [Mycobacterium phage Phabba]
MTGEEAWAQLVGEIGEPGGPTPVDALDFIASNSDGWQAHVASMAYMLAIGAPKEAVLPTMPAEPEGAY